MTPGDALYYTSSAAYFANLLVNRQLCLDDNINVWICFNILMKTQYHTDYWLGLLTFFSFSKSDFHSRYSLIRILDQCVFNAGLSMSDYSWHSFRRGAAMFAFELGLGDTAVQLLGDWSSMAFKRYLEFAFVRKVSVAEKIAKSFKSHVNKIVIWLYLFFMYVLYAVCELLAKWVMFYMID